jgi:hypothetical protein
MQQGTQGEESEEGMNAEIFFPLTSCRQGAFTTRFVCPDSEPWKRHHRQAPQGSYGACKETQAYSGDDTSQPAEHEDHLWKHSQLFKEGGTSQHRSILCYFTSGSGTSQINSVAYAYAEWYGHWPCWSEVSPGYGSLVLARGLLARFL